MTGYFCFIIFFALASARAPACMRKDIQCGVCCCVQSGREEFSAFCSDRDLTSLPSLGWMGSQVKTLALQRNSIVKLQTADIKARFPKVTLMNLSRQKHVPMVTLVGNPLNTVQILGEFCLKSIP